MLARISALSAVATLCLTAPAFAATSQLWGDNGELFDPHGRLMDWSYAGYRYGEEPLPELAATTNVTDYDAVADDGGDDTAAFVDASRRPRAEARTGSKASSRS